MIKDVLIKDRCVVIIFNNTDDCWAWYKKHVPLDIDDRVQVSCYGGYENAIEIKL